jgi:hypothetical protein
VLSRKTYSFMYGLGMMLTMTTSNPIDSNSSIDYRISLDNVREH